MFIRKWRCFKYFYCVFLCNQSFSLPAAGRTKLQLHSTLQVRDRGHKASGPATVDPA